MKTPPKPVFILALSSVTADRYRIISPDRRAPTKHMTHFPHQTGGKIKKTLCGMGQGKIFATHSAVVTMTV